MKGGMYMVTFILIFLILVYIGFDTVVTGIGNFLIAIRDMIHKK